MAIPRSPDARRFYRAALQRLADFSYLLDRERTTGAVYLAGYAVECMLKALILACTPQTEIAATLASFRGSRGHDIAALRWRYNRLGGPALSIAAARAFTIAGDWSTNLRYAPEVIRHRSARAFLDSVRHIVQWAEGRL